jgi:hypothetical protein
MKDRLAWILFSILLAVVCGFTIQDAGNAHRAAKKSSQELTTAKAALVTLQESVDNDPINRARDMAGFKWSFVFVTEGQMCLIEPTPPKGELQLIFCVPEDEPVRGPRPLET